MSDEEKTPIEIEAERILVRKPEFRARGVRAVRRPRRRGFAKDLFVGIDVDKLLATPVVGFEEYMPE